MNDLKSFLKQQIKPPLTILAQIKLSIRLQMIILSRANKNGFLSTALMPSGLPFWVQLEWLPIPTWKSPSGAAVPVEWWQNPTVVWIKL